jgi:hypothetical protein
LIFLLFPFLLFPFSHESERKKTNENERISFLLLLSLLLLRSLKEENVCLNEQQSEGAYEDGLEKENEKQNDGRERRKKRREQERRRQLESAAIAHRQMRKSQRNEKSGEGHLGHSFMRKGRRRDSVKRGKGGKPKGSSDRIRKNVVPKQGEDRKRRER